MFRIDKGVPIPEHKAERSAKYPFRQLDVGDSFFEAAGEKTVSRLQSNLSACASASLGTGNYKTMQTHENGQPGVRVWRTK